MRPNPSTHTTIHCGDVEKVDVEGVSYLRTEARPFHVLRLGPVTFHFATRTEMQRFAVDVLRVAFDPELAS